jgi:hypothetical protein
VPLSQRSVALSHPEPMAGTPLLLPNGDRPTFIRAEWRTPAQGDVDTSVLHYLVDVHTSTSAGTVSAGGHEYGKADVSDRGVYQARGDTAWIPAEHFQPVPHRSASMRTTPTSLGTGPSGRTESSTAMLAPSLETGTPLQVQRPELDLGSARGAPPAARPPKDAMINTTSGPAWFMGVAQMRQAPGSSGSPVEEHYLVRLDYSTSERALTIGGVHYERATSEERKGLTGSGEFIWMPARTWSSAQQHGRLPASDVRLPEFQSVVSQVQRRLSEMQRRSSESDVRILELQRVLSTLRALIAARQPKAVSGFTGLGKRKEPDQDTKASDSSSSAPPNGAWIEESGYLKLSPRHQARIGSVSDARVLLSEGDILLLGTGQVQAQFLRFRRDDLVVRILDKDKPLADDQMLPQNEGRKLKEGEVAVSLTDRVIPDESLSTKLRAGQLSIKGVAVRLFARPVSQNEPFLKLPLLKDLPRFIGQVMCIAGDGVVGKIAATLLNVDLERQLVAVRTKHPHSQFDHLGRLHLLEDPAFKLGMFRYAALAAGRAGLLAEHTRNIGEFILGETGRLPSTPAGRHRLDEPSSWFKEPCGTFVYVLPLDQVKIATGLLQKPSDTDPSARTLLPDGQRGVMWDRLVVGTSGYCRDVDQRVPAIEVITAGMESTSDSSGLPPCHGDLIDPIFGYLPPKQETLMGCWYARRGDVVWVGADNPIALRIEGAAVWNGIGHLFVKSDTAIPPPLQPHVVRTRRLDQKGMIGIQLEHIDATFGSWPSDLDYDHALKDARVISRQGKAVDAFIVQRQSGDEFDPENHGWIDIVSHEEIPWLKPYAIKPVGPTTFKFHYGELPAVDCGVRLGNFVPGRPDLLSQKELHSLALRPEKTTILMNGLPVELTGICDYEQAELIDSGVHVARGSMGGRFDLVAFKPSQKMRFTSLVERGYVEVDAGELGIIGMSSAAFRLRPQDARVDVIAPEELLTVSLTSSAPRKLQVRVPDIQNPSRPLMSDVIELRRQKVDKLGGVNSTFRVPASMSPVTWRTLKAQNPVQTEEDSDDDEIDFVLKTQPQPLPAPAPKTSAPSDSKAPASGSGHYHPGAIRMHSSELSRLRLPPPQRISLTTTRTGTEGAQIVSHVPDIVFYGGRFTDQTTGRTSVVIGVPIDASPETHEVLRAAGSVRETAGFMGEVLVTEYHIPASGDDD